MYHIVQIIATLIYNVDVPAVHAGLDIYFLDSFVALYAGRLR